MTKTHNISKISNCYGCGVCAFACPKHIINMQINKSGFYEPKIIDSKTCTHCGLCLQSCSFVSKDIATSHLVLDYGAMWSKNSEVVQSCSSGGVAFELAKTALTQGYHVIAVRYNVEKQRAEHCVCTTIEELQKTKGSKYIQSFTQDALQSIDLSQKYLVIGSPCQIDSLRRYIKQRKVEQNFILVDFFCHGVPSYNVWQKFIQRYAQKVKNVDDILFRCKKNYTTNEAWLWHASFVVTFKSHYIRKSYQPVFEGERDWFYHYFLDDLCLGKQCYTNCKYKMYSSSADIRIGDAWTNLYKDNEQGVSAVLAFTEIGQKLIKNTANLVVERPDVHQLLNGQMTSAPQTPKYYMLRLALMKSALTFEQIDNLLNTFDKIKHLKYRLYGFIRRHINHA